jgi:hypothetical protein
MVVDAGSQTTLIAGERKGPKALRQVWAGRHADLPPMFYALAMSEQYVSTDKRTGLEVAVTGEFPPHPQDRIRIARTTNLFTRLTSTILAMGSESERREAFIAVETQMELAEAMIRQDMEEVRRLLQETLQRMGVSQDQMREIQDELRRRLGDMGGGMSDLFGPPEELPPEEPLP